MLYQGKEVKVLVVFPQIKPEAIEAARNIKLISGPLPPLKELEYGQDEVNDIVKILDADLLSGKRATIHNFIDSLRGGADIVWLITHAMEEGWFLSDGLVDASETTSLIRSSGAFLTVLNTCSSYEVARTAARELGTAFICTVKPVPDRQAFVTGVLLAQNLAAGYDYVTAYNLAKPGQNSTYELIEATPNMNPIRDPSSGKSQSPYNPPIDNETLTRFTKSVEDMDIIVNGSPRLGIPGMRTQLSGLEVKIETRLLAVEGEIVKLKNLQAVRNWLLWGFGATTLILSISIGVLILQAVNR